MYQVDASLPFAAYVNPKIAEAQSVDAQRDANRGNHINSYAANRKAMGDAYSGDSLVASDFTIPGTTIKWVESTEVQGLAYGFYQEGKQPLPDNFQVVLEACAGQRLAKDGSNSWNASYVEMGFVAGSDGVLPIVQGVDPQTNSIVSVISLA